MAAHKRIKAIQTELAQWENQELANMLYQLLAQQHFAGKLSAQQVTSLCKTFHLTANQLALQLLPIAACYSTTPISQFNVGAIAHGLSGAFYFGANQEFCHVAMQQTIHAEQSAISHAWMNNESSISAITVNYTPCGHCRQFMNELNSAEHLFIHLPHSQDNRLHQYLPDSFGPKDLEIRECLFDPHNNHLQIDATDPLAQQALLAANRSHAPYSHAYCGVAILLDDETMVAGRYAENAAFNPSLPALQVALNVVRLSGYQDQDIVKVAMVEAVAQMQQKTSAEQLLQAINPKIELQYYVARS
ncbi:cytidine deaminase [Gallibacterium melopsittaci]|uniref:Cytidine deaminase n=1 Tax=Gallibacterium melopsittaci TaxID=516063 RepID=A0ABV6HYL3_9PAST